MRTSLLRSLVPSSYGAAKHLIDHLRDSEAVMGYAPVGARISELLDEDELLGHSVTLPVPPRGFTDDQRERIKAYAQSLSYWDELLVEFEFGPDTLLVAFHLVKGEEPESVATSLRERIREWLTPKGFKVARRVGLSLAEQGFKVREPTTAMLVTLTKRFTGHALMVKYPIARSNDEAGICDVYDRLVPRIADVFARSSRLRSEAEIEDDVVTIFFTTNQRYVSSLYEAITQFRIILPRPKTCGWFDFRLFARPTYRACKALSSKYRKGFLMMKRPLPVWGGFGHCLILHYKRGAGGKVVDDSYVSVVRRMTERLMRRFKLRATLQLKPATRTIVVTFFNRADERYSADQRTRCLVAVDTGPFAATHYDDRESVGSRALTLDVPTLATRP